MKNLTLKLLASFILFLFASSVMAMRIVSSQNAQVYEMKSCIQDQDVSGCRGIILNDVVLKDFWGNKKKIKHLFFRNLRSENGPVSKECLAGYVQKMNKYLGSEDIMDSFSKRSKAKWSDPEDGSIFTFPSFVNSTKLDQNQSAYGLPTFRSTDFYFKSPEGIECSFSISMDDHLEDKPVAASTAIADNSPDQGLAVISSDQKEEDGSVGESSRATDDNSNIQCDGRSDQGNPLNQDVASQVTQLDRVSEAVYKKDLLLESDITYGLFKMNAATAKVFLETDNGKIKTLSMLGSYSIMGMEGTVAQSVNGADLMSGGSVGFAVDTGLSPILKITPGNDFSLENGGTLRFDFWDGTKYKSVDARLVKDTLGNFKVKQVSEGSNEDVNYLAVNVRGLSESGMRIHDYQVSNR